MKPYDTSDSDAGGGFVINRRQFLGAVGASSLATQAWAEDGTDDMDDHRVVFKWARDPGSGARVLDVVLILRDHRDPGVTGAPPQEATYARAWRIRPETFGPRARFILSRADGESSRDVLRIRDVGYGRLTGRTNTFVFRKVDRLVSVKGVAVTRTRIVLTMSTSVWSSSKGPTYTSHFALEADDGTPEITFRNFVKGAEFGQKLNAIRVSNTAALMFNGLISSVRGREETLVEVRFAADAIWQVRNARGRIAAFGQRVKLDAVRIWWPLVTAEADSALQEAALFGEATFLTGEAGALPLTLGGPSGPRWTATRRAAIGKVQFRAQAVAGDDGKAAPSSVVRAEAVLSGTWTGARFDAGGTVGPVGPLPDLAGSILERVEALGTPSNDDPARRGGSISVQANYAEAAPATRAASPIGQLTLTSLRQTEDGEAPPQTAFPTRRNWPVTALWHWGSGHGSASRDAPRAGFVEAAVAMVEAGVAPANAEYSRLTFDETALRIFYAPGPRPAPPAGSVIDLGARDLVGIATLDLSRATLRASQSTQLLSLLFRFSDLALRFDGPRVSLVNSAADCALETRPRRGPDDLVPHDRRPVLVVEFPPQHLFEEVRFYPARPEPPDAPLDLRVTVRKCGADAGKIEAKTKHPDRDRHLVETDTQIVFETDNRAHVVEALAALTRCTGDDAAAEAFRVALRKLKSTESTDAAQQEAFNAFQAKVKSPLQLLTATNNLPRSQTVYIGPYALDVDAMGLVRGIFEQSRKERARALVLDMFGAVDASRATLEQSYPAGNDFAAALDVDIRIQRVVPLYQQFRTFYRDVLTASYLGDTSPPGNTLGGSKAQSTAPDEVEYIDLVRTATGHPLATDARRTRLAKLEAAFVEELMGRESLSGPMRGRLANPSRLAFRLNCLDGLDAARVARGEALDNPDDAAARLPRQQLDFDLVELLKFRGMELSVTRRAEIVYDPGQLGLIGARDPRVADVSVGAMLKRLDFSRGPQASVAERLGEVAASLTAPEWLETAIEMPARLVLSPHQNAIVLTPQQPAGFDQVFDHTIPAGCVSTTGPRPGAVVRRLWAATFVTKADGLNLDPGIRAVHSPDLRPEALLARFADRAAAAGGGNLAVSQPPGGPLDPWYLGKTQSETSGMSQEQLNALYSRRLNREVAVCDEIKDTQRARSYPAIVRDLCKRLGLFASDARLQFRSSLDARDRHQIVMLSSAWGLPIIDAPPGASEREALTAQPEDEWALWDIEPGNGNYQPQTLDVSELTLTALGGVLRHDTGFRPPVAARHWLDQSPVFDAFTVERWQHWINLGRDLFTEVVYKGYLFPLGVRASLVKVTERVFWMDPATGAITAPLRQRMFIRVAKPEKLYPAVKQPHDGRGFPVRRLEILTTMTPDIVDPYSGIANGDADPSDTPLPSGRLNIEGTRGLVFWPRTLKAPEGNLRFEMEVDGIKTDLPLIFADQTAVDDRETVKQLCRYYNTHAAVPSPDAGGRASVDPVRHLRTLRFHGAERRYAAETEAGSATFQTDHWTLRASGGATAVSGRKSGTTDTSALGWADFPNADYAFGPLQQIADQPPFYPAIETARLHLTQAERLTGRVYEPVRADFDAHYVEFGLPLPEAGAKAAPPSGTEDKDMQKNPGEVILVLLDQPELDMLNKGDQSGGVFRPNGNIVGLSRAKGAMTQGIRTTRDDTPEVTTQRLFSLSAKFDAGLTLPKASDEASTGSGAGPAGDPFGTDFRDKLEEVRKIFESLFTCDSKILGLICMRDLIRLIQRFAAPEKGMPDLSEKMEFGAAGEVAAEAAETVRIEVIAPLAAAVRRVRDEWDQIERQIARATSAGLAKLDAGTATEAKIVRIRDVFPDLYDSLAELDRALSRAAGETDPILFSFQLGACFSAGQRFLAAVERAAANPGQALERALSQQFGTVLSLLQALNGGVDDWLATILDRLGLDQAGLKAALPGFIVDQFPAGSADVLRLELIALPHPAPASADAAAHARLRSCLAPLLPSAEDIKKVLTSFAGYAVAESLATGKRPDLDAVLGKWLRDPAEKIRFDPMPMVPAVFVNALEDAIPALKTALSAEMQPPLRAEMEAAIDALQTRFDQQKAALFDVTAGSVQEIVDAGPPSDQIRKRYYTQLLLTAAGPDAAVIAKCLADLAPDYPIDILQFLTRLLSPPDVDLPSFELDIRAYLRPLGDILRDLLRLLDGIHLGHFPDVLSALASLLDKLGFSLPALDACGVFAPVWAVVQDVLTHGAIVAGEIDLVPDRWEYPTGARELDPDELILSAEIDALPGADPDSLASLLLRGRAAALRLHARVAKADTDLRKATAAATSKIAALPDSQEKADALAALDTAAASASGASVRLERLATEFWKTFKLLLRDSAALRQTARDMRLAARLDPCGGKVAAEQLVALANLPRDVELFAQRRENLIKALHGQLVALATAIEDLRKLGPTSLVPLAIATGDYLIGLKLWEKKGDGSVGVPAWAASATVEIDRLRDEVQKAANDVAPLVDTVAKTLCSSIGIAMAALDQLEALNDMLDDRLDAAEAANVPLAGAALTRMRAAWRANPVDARLEDARQILAEIAMLSKAMCEDGKLFAHLGEIDAIKVAGKSPFAVLGIDGSPDPKLIAAAELIRQTGDQIAPLVGEVRAIIDQGPRKAGAQLVAQLLARAVDQEISAPDVPLAKNGKLSVAIIYDAVKTARDALYKSAGETPVLGAGFKPRLLVPADAARPKVGSFTPGEDDPARDQLAGDVAWLTALSAQAKAGTIEDATTDFVSEFLREWAAGVPTPIQILGNIGDLVEDVFSGELYRFLDFARLREEFEGYILSLVPTRQRMGFGFDLFLGDNVAAATGGIFKPAPGTTLGIDVQVEINLAPLVDGKTPAITGASIGELGPFEVKLVGDMFDALTLRFGSARFESRMGEKPRFDISYVGHKIGPKLQFVQRLQSYLAPKDGSGAILRFDPTKPGVEAGYRLQLGDFSVGNVAFSNIGLEATAILPFSERGEALFKASLSSRASPFTLTYAPYGGSGFFAILANVGGIIGFEASFEFGGSAVFAFGPLSGQGRVMSGVYIRQLKLDGMRVTEISMTFFAGGSASIWIFNFAASLSLSMGMVNGAMSGTATFSFSFSMGLADFEYSVEMVKSEGEGFSGQQQSSSNASFARRFAGLDTMDKTAVGTSKFGAVIENRAKCQGENWTTFKSYFDDNTLPQDYF